MGAEVKKVTVYDVAEALTAHFWPMEDYLPRVKMLDGRVRDGNFEDITADTPMDTFVPDGHVLEQILTLALAQSLADCGVDQRDPHETDEAALAEIQKCLTVGDLVKWCNGEPI